METTHSPIADIMQKYHHTVNIRCSCQPTYFEFQLKVHLAIAILSVRPSVTRVDQAKTVQARVIKSSPSAAWKTLVSGTVKLFYKFEGNHPERGR